MNTTIQTFTNKSNIRLGFEIECYIRRSAGRDALLRFRELKVEMGTDGSINAPNEYNYTAIELRTKPLPPESAMILLKTIFDILQKNGGTNASCGLHVNISSKDRNEMKRFNPIPFFVSPLWSEILESFHRNGNMYCQIPIQSFQRNATFENLGKDLDRVRTNKYLCANMINFNHGEHKNSRIEVRGFGNLNYHKRFKSISEFVERIIKLFEYSCNTPITPNI